jgi:enoyl-CoA hydratase
VSKVGYERRGSAAVLTITRPERRNAVDDETARLLLERFHEFEADDDARALVLTGEGPEAFCAGADLKALAERAEAFGGDDPAAAVDSWLRERPGGPLGFTRLRASKPTIAAISGWCLAGGLELALWCDLRIATRDARLGLTERRFGVPLIDGGTQRLPRIVGIGRAIEMILTGRFVDAAEAHAIGLITAVVPAEGLRAELRRLADQILAKGPLAVRLAKLVVRAGMDADQRTGQVVEQLAQALLYTTADKAEGASAFLEKRLPAFKGV